MTDEDLEDEISEIDEIFSEMFPDIEERRRAMQLLLTSVGIADSVCPDAWSASMFANGFGLNVARVEVLVILERVVRMNLQAQLGAAPFTGPRFEEVYYASQPRPQCAFVSDIANFPVDAVVLAEKHAAFIRTAGTTKAGKAVAGSPFTKSHRPGLIAYAERLIAGDDDDDSIELWTTEEEALPDDAFIEGGRTAVLVNAYERSAAARQACIDHHGAKCAICDFDFADRYGPQLEGFIHVHHVVPLHMLSEEHVVDPINDLRPVCPNCHAVIHSRNPEFSMAAVQALLRSRA